MAEALRMQESTLEAKNQESIDLLTESIQRIKLLSKMLWQVDGLDKVELGTLAVMLSNEADNLYTTTATLELQLAEVHHG
jgi:hypothetical protein